MKKISAMLLITVLFLSCGKDKKKDSENQDVVQDQKDSYSLIMDAIYEKDDSIKIVYKAAGFWSEDSPVNFAVKGNAAPQRIEIKMPDGVVVENLKIFISTNKEQQTLKILTMTLQNNGISALPDPALYYEYFDANGSVGWDDINKRNTLDHTKDFPPGLSGNTKLESNLPL